VTLVSRVLIGFSLLLALSATGAVFAVLGAYRASAELEHADLARRQHAACLGLSNHAYQLFKQYAGVALRGSPKTPAAYREALERSRTAAGHCTRIVNDLPSIARHELGATSTHVESVDLTELLPRVVEASVALHGGGARSTGVRGTEQPRLVAADPVRIRQVLLIPLENAVSCGCARIQVAPEPVPAGWRASASATTAPA
jgi:signal transduction histidine kinase